MGQLSGLKHACSIVWDTALMAAPIRADSLLRLLMIFARAAKDVPLAAGDAQTHVDQSVLTVIAADTVDGL